MLRDDTEAKIFGALKFETIWNNLKQFWNNLKQFETIWNNLKQFETIFGTILFPQDMIQDILYKLHWNIIHKSTRVTWNVGPYKLIRLPGHSNLNLRST